MHVAWGSTRNTLPVWSLCCAGLVPWCGAAQQCVSCMWWPLMLLVQARAAADPAWLCPRQTDHRVLSGCAGGKGAAGKPSSYAAAASVPTSAPPGISVPDRAGSADKRKRKTRAEVNAARRAAAEAAGEPSSNGAGPGKGADAAGGSRRAARVERPPPGDKGGSKAAGGASKAAGVVSKAAAGSSKPVELYDEFSTCVPTDAAAAASGVPTTVQVRQQGTAAMRRHCMHACGGAMLPAAALLMC